MSICTSSRSASLFTRGVTKYKERMSLLEGLRWARPGPGVGPMFMSVMCFLVVPVLDSLVRVGDHGLA